jgi:hypothetical protein
MIVPAAQAASSASSAAPVNRPALHDRVRVPGGREGDVIGFYRRVNESVLVLFSSGETDEFLEPDVELLP